MNDGILQAGPEAPRQQTPSQTITREATAIFYCTDTKGRRIGFKRLTVLERLRMFQVIGPEDSSNPAVLNMVVPALYATDIDGMELPTVVRSPTAFRVIEARIKTLGDEGIEAVATAMSEQFGDDALKKTDDAKN